MSVNDDGDDLGELADWEREFLERQAAEQAEATPAVSAQAGLAAAQSAASPEPQPGTDDDNQDEG